MTSPLEDHIREHGYGIFKGFVDGARVEELKQLCESLKQAAEARGLDGNPVTTYRVPNLIAKTRELDNIITDPRLLAIFRSIISTDEVWGMNLSDVSVKYLVPGQDSRSLHRDDDVYPQLSSGQPFTANALLALDRFDEPVGATTIVPGSHRWDHPIDQYHERVAVEMDPGDLLILSGRVWHGHGQNTTTDRIRRAFNVYVCAGWLQSAHPGGRLELSEQEVAGLPEAMQELFHLGMRVGKYLRPR